MRISDWSSDVCSSDLAPFAQRMDENPDAKRLIAGQVARMIKNGDSLILDIGSTTAYVARALRGHHDLFVVTNSLAVAQMLATRNNNRVFMAGGELRAHDAGPFGPEAIPFVRQFSVSSEECRVGKRGARTCLSEWVTGL